MKLLLRRSIEHVGKIGDIVNVSSGYGRNYLLPQRLAVPVTPDNRRLIEVEKVEEAKRESERKGSAETLQRELQKLEVSITVKAQDDGTLYGSVTPHQICDKIKESGKISIDTKQVKIAEPIKKTGDHVVEIKLHPEVYAQVKVKVLAEAED